MQVVVVVAVIVAKHTAVKVG
jgi:hypothetical protein